MTKIENFWEGVEEINNKMNNYRLCIDTTSNLYVYCCDAYDSTNRPERCSWTYNEEKTFFYRYIKLEEVPSVSPAFKVTSKVIWYSKGYKEFEINSIFTDFKRF
jgi:hypothetical protein